jgi:hypothetical protein
MGSFDEVPLDLELSGPGRGVQVKTLLTEAAELEGASPFVHVGGDEVKFPCWDNSSRCGASSDRTGLCRH